MVTINSEPLPPPHTASLCPTSWILQIFLSAITQEWLFLLEQSYLLAAEEKERGEGLNLCTLTAEILECPAIVGNLKRAFPNKKLQKSLRRSFFSICKYWFSCSITIRQKEKKLTKGENLFIRRYVTCAKRKREQSRLGRQFAFVFAM